MPMNCRRRSRSRKRATGAGPTNCSGRIRRRTSGSSCWRRWRKNSRRVAFLRISISSSECGGLWYVLPLGLPDCVQLRVPGHYEDCSEDDHHEDGEQDQVQQLRDVGRTAREDRSVKTPGTDHEEPPRERTRQLAVVGSCIQQKESEGEAHRREASPPKTPIRT